MKKKLLLAGIISSFLFIAIATNGFVFNEDRLKEDYYELITIVSELFKDHTQIGDQYYNQSYPSKGEVSELLDQKVTDDGFALVINQLFEENDEEIYVYKPQYQEFLRDSFNFSVKKKKDHTYYRYFKNSILNPALRLIDFEQFTIQRENNKVVLEGRNIQVDFYDEDRSHQYERFGYPPKDFLTISLTFIYEEGKYLLDDFQVNSSDL